MRYRKAAAVGRLLLGELDAPLRDISIDDYLLRNRRELISERDQLRGSLRGELAKFCRDNFENVGAEDLGKLYEVLVKNRSIWFAPLAVFEREIGRLKPGVLKGAPLHATVHISPWGLQTDFPEQHLLQDLAVSLSGAIEIEEKQLTRFRTRSWSENKKIGARTDLAELLRRRNAYQRACVLSCFNLVEAYINGVSWDHVQEHDISGLSEKNRNVLTESESMVKIETKLIRVPALVAGREAGPLHQTRDPLKSFIEIIKPYRDAIVHASPFAAPQRFGGYDKLTKLYALNLATVRKAVDVAVDVIKEVYQFIGGRGELPPWFPPRDADGNFIIVPDTGAK